MDTTNTAPLTIGASATRQATGSIRAGETLCGGLAVCRLDRAGRAWTDRSANAPEAVSEPIYRNVHNGVYRCGFATTQCDPADAG
jgi:hypothetical protein